MSRPSISVVMPYYKKARWVGRAVRSALLQTFPPTEIVIVDDCSPEALPNWLRAEPKVRIIRHERNGGAAAARNTGVSESRCELVAFLDADDFWFFNKLDRQVARLAAAEAEAAGDIAVATGFLSSKSFSSRILCGVPRASANPLDFASGCWFCPGSTVLLRREAFLRHGPYDTALRRLEDTLWFLRFALGGGRLVSVQSIEAVIVQDAKPDSATLDLVVPQLLKAIRERDPDRDMPRPLGLINRLQAYGDLEIASSAWYEGAHGKAIWHLVRSFARAPRVKLQLDDFVAPAELDAASLGID